LIQTTTLAVAGMTCGMCERHVMRALEGMTGVMDVQVNLQDQQVRVDHLADWIEASSLTAALRDAGYRARPIGHDLYTGERAGHRTDRSGAVSHSA
jgi:copper chaperone CopZ